MLTPESIDALRDVALGITQPATDFMLRDICRRVAKAGKITSTAAYQLYRTAALGAAKKKVAAYLKANSKIADSAIDDIFEYAGKNAAFEYNESLQQMVKAYAKACKRNTANILDKTMATAPNGKQYPLYETYGKTMDYAFKQVFTGAEDYNSALHSATKDLAKRGITTLPQKDGRSVGIEYAARRFIMNNLGAMNTAIEDENFKALGADGWEISAHSACAPDHEDIQGRQYTDKVYRAMNSDLQRPIGELNCGHFGRAIILGVNSQQYSDAELAQMKEDNAQGITYQGQHYTLYEAGQMQQKVESTIRRQKRSVLAAEELGDKRALQTSQIRLNILKEEYIRYSRAAGLSTQNQRLQVVGFEHSAASKAVWAGREFTQTQVRDIFKRGNGASETTGAGHVHKILGKIDPADTKSFNDLTDSFCKQYAKSNVENMLIVTKNGEVHFVTDSSPTGISLTGLEDALKGSYNIHSHPPDYTQFSFSDEADIPSFFADGSAVMEAVDYKYRYRFERPDISFEEWDKVRFEVKSDMPNVLSKRGLEIDTANLEELLQDILIDETCKRLGLKSYRRWLFD